MPRVKVPVPPPQQPVQKPPRKRPTPTPPAALGSAKARGKKAHATAVEMQARRAYAAKLLALGLPAEDVVQHLQEAGTNFRQAREAIRQARKMMQARDRRGRSRAREEQVTRLEAYLYGELVDDGAMSDVLAIERLLMDVQGTKAVAREETPPRHAKREALIAIIEEMTDEELDAIELAERRGPASSEA